MITIISKMDSSLPEPFSLLPSGATAPFRLTAGEALFRTDDRSRGCYFLERGEMHLLRWSLDGRETIIHIARAGETFAEASLFSARYHCDAVAAADSSGLLLRKANIDRLFRVDAGFARQLTARFARQVQSLRRRIEIASIRSAEERVLAALGEYENPASSTFENLPPLKTLAAQIGLSHEALYRSIARLVRKGALVRLGRGRIQPAKAVHAQGRRVPHAP
jgi:CRP-like cAMP-binding protein